MPQKGNQYQDKAELFRIRPDYLCFQNGGVVHIEDAKYKVIGARSEISNADITQLIAYCTRFKPQTGHLIFASAPEFEAVMANSDVKVMVHEIDLSLPAETLEQKVNEVFNSIVRESQPG